MHRVHTLKNSRGLNGVYVTPALLITGFLLAVQLRVLIGGVGPAQSVVAGLLFAAVLVVFCGIQGVKSTISPRIVLIGVLGAALLCIVPLIQNGVTGQHPEGNYAQWAMVVSIVALAEEAFLRGALYDAIKQVRSDGWAIVVAALLFAILHIPLYGWHTVPLNFVVGIWFGMLRLQTNTWVAPGIAHTLADLGAWWLV